MSDPLQKSDLLAVSRRVWLRAFWGFEPEGEGYVGFTHEANRRRFIREYKEGDLILIYGADNSNTAREKRRQVLGFLDIEPSEIWDTDKSSSERQDWKTLKGWKDRWRFAIPVRRAWRITRKIEAHHIASRTFATHEPRLIASRAELLLPAEAGAVLDLPVVRVNVFGEPPIEGLGGEAEESIRKLLSPSRGVPPSFGDRSYAVEDEENQLYALMLEGSVAAFLGRDKTEVINKVIVKVGHAKAPQSRCDSHNSHLPEAGQFRWKVKLVSRPFPGGREAKEAEDRLKIRFSQKFESLGREFFLVDRTILEKEFADAAKSQSFLISF